MGLGRPPPAAARRRRRLHRVAGDWILRRARGAAPLRRGPHRGRRRADLGPPRRARPLAQPGGAVPRGHRGRTHGVSAGIGAGQRRRLRLRGADHRRPAAALQRPAGSAGAGHRQAARLRQREPDGHLAHPARLGPRPVAHSAPGRAVRRARRLLWLAVRAPVGGALDLQPFFSPATFFRPLLGPLSGSAGALALAGTLLTIAGVWLWRRRLPRRWYGVALGAGAAPRCALPHQQPRPGHHAAGRRRVGRPLAQLAARHPGLRRGAHRPDGRALPRLGTPAIPRLGDIAAGVAIAVAAATVGVLVWSPRGGWPDWYTFLWTPALLLVALPAPRWATISGIALVAGSSAALVTWGAELAGKIQVAQRDIARLGVEPDPLAVPLLERFGEQVLESPAPDERLRDVRAVARLGAGRSGLSRRISLCGPAPAGCSTSCRSIRSISRPRCCPRWCASSVPSESQRVAQLSRVPGVHYVLLVRVSAGRGHDRRRSVPARSW